jgi:hypothetical protein
MGVFIFAVFFRRDARVAERGGLENRYTRKSIQGSNPCLSAKSKDGLIRNRADHPYSNKKLLLNRRTNEVDERSRHGVRLILLLKPQRLDRVKLRSFLRGIISG